MAEFAAYEAFSPLDYLQAYYSELKSEAGGLLAFLVGEFAKLDAGVDVLEFGGGPTLIGLIPAARRAGTVHFCDYVDANRAYVQDWLAGRDEAFDWRPFIARCLELEAGATPLPAMVAERAARLRSVVNRVTGCDIYATPPVQTDRTFDVIISNYCLDAVTSSDAEWVAHIRNVKSLLKPGGRLLLASLENATYSDFGATRYPNVRLTETSVRAGLEAAGFDPALISITCAPADHAEREYTGVIFSSAIQPVTQGDRQAK